MEARGGREATFCHITCWLSRLSPPPLLLFGHRQSKQGILLLPPLRWAWQSGNGRKRGFVLRPLLLLGGAAAAADGNNTRGGEHNITPPFLLLLGRSPLSGIGRVGRGGGGLLAFKRERRGEGGGGQFKHYSGLSHSSGLFGIKGQIGQQKKRWREVNNTSTLELE